MDQSEIAICVKKIGDSTYARGPSANGRLMA
jgi:hypothetical protein